MCPTSSTKVDRGRGAWLRERMHEWSFTKTIRWRAKNIWPAISSSLNSWRVHVTWRQKGEQVDPLCCCCSLISITFCVLIKAAFISTSCDRVQYCILRLLATTCWGWGGHISKPTACLGRGAFWITTARLRLCFQGQNRIPHRLCFQSHTCKLKVLQEVRVELSVRGQVLWPWSAWGHKCRKHIWDRMMLFQITNPFNNSKQKYWWCLSFHIKSIQGLALPCGRVYRHVRAHFLSKRTPRKW